MKTFLASLLLLAFACVGIGYVCMPVTFGADGVTKIKAAEDHETLSPVPCKLHNYDVEKITNAIKQRVPQDFLLKVLNRSAGIEIARVEAIRKLIDDAYKNTSKIDRWYENHIWVCADT